MKKKQKYHYHERQGVTGTLQYTVYKNGVAIEHVEEHNLVVDGGRHRLAQLVAGDSTYGVERIGVGTGIDAEFHTDTALTNQLTFPVTGHTVDAGDAIFSWRLSENDANGMEIHEFGLFDTYSTMLTHQVRSRSIGKEADIVIQGTYTLHF